MVVGWDGCISPDFVCFNHFHHALTGGYYGIKYLWNYLFLLMLMLDYNNKYNSFALSKKRSWPKLKL